MVKLNIVKISQPEKLSLERSFEADKDREGTLEQLIKDNENQTLIVLRQIKNIVKWDDIEDMVNFVDLIKLVDTDACSVDVDDKYTKLGVKVFASAAATGSINGVALEKFIEVYATFREAS